MSISPSMLEKDQQHIGIFGGTFDPIHLGHTKPSEDIAKQLGLSQVLLVPAHIPPHKQSTVASTLQRKKMVELVCNESSLFTLDERELKRHTKSVTIDSIKELKQQHPNARLYFFIGTDSLISLPTWHQIQELLTLCHFVVSTRPGYCPTTLCDESICKRITDDINLVKQQSAGKILLLETCQVNISSTEIRKKLNGKEDCSEFLSKSVAQFIEQHKLYR
ncbi:nicotinate-nucleotide adenylyltransferase [Thalassotalea fonticola]|uniref:Probable nicotinate-nucleotide adenylyltransferase n=1 Tax=Thalassotalea fonticola TaxID=3065649 RepID=A0ABZ0GNR7_9GAMM|nr:nicotinate-nucleotide adenylyltransferase [Colwelliaceae bacterium S1-1]